MVFDDVGLVKEFVIESNEHLANIESQLLEIESNGADINVDLVNTVFRAVHSIKGAAGFMGFVSIKGLAHSLENVLNLMRDRELTPTSEVTDVLLRSSDLLRSLLNDIDNSNDVDVSDLRSQLDTIAAGATSVDEPDSKAPASADHAVAKPFPPSTEPSPSAQSPTEQPAEYELREKTSATAPSTESSIGIDREAKPVASTPAPPQAETNIRVSVDVLDNLMNLAGELVLGRNQLVQSVNTAQKEGIDAVATRLDQITSELQEAIMKTRMQPIGSVFGRFTRVVRDLSGQLGKECSIQIDGKEVEVDKTIIEAIGDPLTHLVRNSIDHGIESPEVRQQKGKSPVGAVHLRAYHRSGKVRIEIADDGKGIDPEVLKGKAVEKGLLTQHNANALSDREAVRLIFHPGFSTAQAVTEVSGRGVGMDVVRSNIEKLGGTVDVETRLDQGTTIVVTLPLTLAIIPSLIVANKQHRFAIPQANISELVRVRAEELDERIGKLRDKEVLRLRGSLLPLVRLRDALAKEGLSSDGRAGDDVRNVIVVESGSLRYGLVVDDLFDSEEIVIKPLGRHLKDSVCLSGATILGDGRIALILDVQGIAQQTKLRTSEGTHPALEAERGGSQTQDTQPVLLFTNSPSEQFAIPMETIARVERIRWDQIGTMGGHKLLQYRGGSLPILSLEDLIDAEPAPELDSLYVVVAEAAGREVGLIVPRLVDIRDVPTNFDPSTFDDQGVIGSQLIDSCTTRLLDTIELARKARPDWFTASQRAASSHVRQDILRHGRSAASRVSTPTESDSAGTVLLAEDSAFFRRQVKSFLEEAGFSVVDCEDGREAWRTLEAAPNRFNLVLSDIEMPNMDGLELTRRIRSEDRFAGLPIVALTSLASQEDYQRGYDAGVDEYQVKLDREALLAAVRRFATPSEQPVEV